MAMTRPVRVVVVDDHRMFAEALELLLEGEEDMVTAGIAHSGEEALASLSETAPDVVLMDLDLPGMTGVEAIRRIRKLSPSTQVVVISAMQDPSDMAAALSAGACGFVPKTEAADDLVGMIRRAVAGEIVLSSRDLRDALIKLKAAQRSRSDAEQLLYQLTHREIQLLQAMAEGASTRELAQRLFISQRTVQTHVKNILAKLGVHSKLEAVTFALRYEVIRIPGRDRYQGAG
jgi:DNA-binding NarL/FixJ family response regulator